MRQLDIDVGVDDRAARLRVPVDGGHLPRLPARRPRVLGAGLPRAACIGYGVLSCAASEAHVLNLCVGPGVPGPRPRPPPAAPAGGPRALAHERPHLPGGAALEPGRDRAVPRRGLQRDRPPAELLPGRKRAARTPSSWHASCCRPAWARRRQDAAARAPVAASAGQARPAGRELLALGAEAGDALVSCATTSPARCATKLAFDSLPWHLSISAPHALDLLVQARDFGAPGRPGPPAGSAASVAPTQRRREGGRSGSPAPRRRALPRPSTGT